MSRREIVLFGALLFGGIWLLTSVGLLVWAQRLTKHRTDIRPGQWFFLGRSWKTHENYLGRGNYSDEAGRDLRGYWLLNRVRLVAFAVFFALLLAHVANPD